MRVRRITHPVLGPATWAEIKAFFQRTKESGSKRCIWCHAPVPQGRITRCGSLECAELIWQASSWGRCAVICLRLAKHLCANCGAHASEADHILPVSLGGTDDQSNLRALCRVCHKLATAALRKYGSRYPLIDPFRVEKSGSLELGAAT